MRLLTESAKCSAGRSCNTGVSKKLIWAYLVDFNSLTSESVSSEAERQRWAVHNWIKMKPWHRSGKPSHTCFSFPLVISGNENWNCCYIFWGLEGLYIFLSYNMLVIKCMSLSAKRQDLSVPGRIRKKILKEYSLKNRFSAYFHNSRWKAAAFLPVCWHAHVLFSLPFCTLASPFIQDLNGKVE